MVLGHEDIEMNLSSSNITIENIDILSLNGILSACQKRKNVKQYKIFR